MKVKVTKQCDRCKRQEAIEVDSTELPELEERQQRQQACINELTAAFTQFAAEDVPDLVIYFKGKVMTINCVCDAFCKRTVENNLKHVFREVDPTTRKPRGRKTKKTVEGEGVVEVSMADETEDQTEDFKNETPLEVQGGNHSQEVIPEVQV